MTNFSVIDCKETVGNVLDLLEGLSAATSLEEVFVVDIKVASFGMFNLITYADLAVEEGFALVALINTRT